MTHPPPHISPQRIMDMSSAFYDSCVLFAASDAGIFAHLAETPGAMADATAAACGLNSRGARLLLDACVALDLLVKTDETYTNAPEAAAFLTPSAAFDLSKAIRYNRDVYDAWGKLPQFASTGKPVERPEIHLGEDLDRTRAFVLSMHGRCMAIGRAVVPMLDLSNSRQLLDIGGGPGAYSVLCAQANPELRCTVLDLPGVVAVASELIEQAGMSDRVSTVPGDYHVTPFPAGNDVVNIFGVLHQESPEDIRDIAQRAYASLKPDGKIHILDMMTDVSHTQPAFSALFALNMALTTENGWVFSSDEMIGWLEEAGFVDCTCTPLPPPMPHWMITARK